MYYNDNINKRGKITTFCIDGPHSFKYIYNPALVIKCYFPLKKLLNTPGGVWRWYLKGRDRSWKYWTYLSIEFYTASTDWLVHFMGNDRICLDIFTNSYGLNENVWIYVASYILQIKGIYWFDCKRNCITTTYVV